MKRSLQVIGIIIITLGGLIMFAAYAGNLRGPDGMSDPEVAAYNTKVNRLFIVAGGLAAAGGMTVIYLAGRKQK